MDVYKIGVSIALANGVSAVLGVIQKDVMGLKKAVDLTNGSLNRMKIAVAGMAMVGFDGAMLVGLNKLEKAGEKYVEQLELMKVAGMDAAEQHAAIFAANRVSSEVRTTSPTENLQSIRELRAALNSVGASPKEATEEAIKYLAVVQKAQLVMQATAGGRAMSANNGVYEMVKALEEIGATRNPERFERLLGGMAQASEAFGGKVTARDWFQTLKYTRGAGQFYNDDFIQHYLPTLIQEMKSGGGTGSGGGPGNPLASLYQEVVGGTFGHKTRDLGLQLGLIDPSKSEVDGHGRIHNAPGAFYGADLAAANPALFIQKFIIPALSQQMQGHLLDRTEDGQYVHVKEVAGIMATLFGNRTSQQMVGLLEQVQKMEGDKRLVESAKPLNEAADELSKHNPATVLKEFNEQLERFETDLGKALVPFKMGFLTGLTDGLAKFSELSERYPNATAWIVGTAAAMSSLLVVMGALAIAGAALSAFPGGWIIMAIAAGLSALGAAAYWLWKHVNWSELASAVRAGLDRITSAITGWIASIPSIAAQVAAELAKVGQAILGWARGLFAAAPQAPGPTPSASSADMPHPGASGLIDPSRPGSAYGPGSLFHRNSFVPPPANNNHVTLIHYTVLDSKVVAKSVSSLMARDGSGPSGGATGFDGRAGYVGGMQMGAA